MVPLALYSYCHVEASLQHLCSYESFIGGDVFIKSIHYITDSFLFGAAKEIIENGSFRRMNFGRRLNSSRCGSRSYEDEWKRREEDIKTMMLS